MHAECFPREGLKILARLRDIINAHGFTLAGGTAAAIQVGHRLSEDLDFFTGQTFSTERIIREIKRQGLEFKLLQEGPGTLAGIAGNTKVSFFFYPYPFLGKQLCWQGIPVADPVDIAAMKVIAICQRGAKRDFIDLYFLLRSIPFWRIADNMIRSFGPDRVNPVHIGKSLVYFHDAAADPDPAYRPGHDTDWGAVRQFFAGHVRQMVLDLETAKARDETETGV